jgi:SCP-2 sterol transfer family protein
VELPASAVACHLLEELLVHGFDVAQATRARWKIEPAHAVLAIEGAAVPILAASPDTWAKPSAAHLRARIEIRVRRHNRFVLVFDDGLSIEAPPSKSRADAYFSAEPEGLLLFLLGRRGPGRLLLTGKAVAWGRRPQALLASRRVLSPP